MYGVLCWPLHNVVTENNSIFFDTYTFYAMIHFLNRYKKYYNTAFRLREKITIWLGLPYHVEKRTFKHFSFSSEKIKYDTAFTLQIQPFSDQI